MTPKFDYCCVVWRPYLRKHIQAIERLQNRFVRRVSFRCQVPREAIVLKPISEIFDAADLRMFSNICERNVTDDYLSIRMNGLRSGETISSLEIAATERINQQFA